MRSHTRISTYVQNPQHGGKSPVPTSLSTVQSHVPIGNFVVATGTLVTVTFCFHNSALCCFALNEMFDMLQQEEILYFGSTNLASHAQFQIIKSNHSCKRGCTCEVPLVLQFHPGMDWIHKHFILFRDTQPLMTASRYERTDPRIQSGYERTDPRIQSGYERIDPRIPSVEKQLQTKWESYFGSKNHD